MIGIGITSFGDNSKRDACIAKIEDMRPCDCKIHIARNIKGIPQAKNDCLRNLDYCDHIFLFDDDCYPLVRGWEIPYINSDEHHLCFTWRRKVLQTNGRLVNYELPDGQMMYFTKRCLDAVGGFDEEYDTWGFEHVDYSQRVYNAGLTSWKYMDVVNSKSLLYTLDQDSQVRTSVPDRGLYIAKNKARFEAQKDSKEFKAYK